MGTCCPCNFITRRLTARMPAKPKPDPPSPSAPTVAASAAGAYGATSQCRSCEAGSDARRSGLLSRLALAQAGRPPGDPDAEQGCSVGKRQADRAAARGARRTVSKRPPGGGPCMSLRCRIRRRVAGRPRTQQSLGRGAAELPRLARRMRGRRLAPTSSGCMILPAQAPESASGSNRPPIARYPNAQSTGGSSVRCRCFRKPPSKQAFETASGLES